MAETADDLSAPLGQKTVRAKRRFRLPFTGMQVLAVLLGLFLVIFAGFALFNANPFGGEPIVRIALPRRPRAKSPQRRRRRIRAGWQVRSQADRRGRAKRP